MGVHVISSSPVEEPPPCKPPIILSNILMHPREVKKKIRITQAYCKLQKKLEVAFERTSRSSTTEHKFLQ